MNEKVKLCEKQGSEGQKRPHVLKSSYCGRMISDLRVQIG